MFEKFTSADADNFRQRYVGTFGYFRKGTNKTLVRLEDVVTNRDKVVQFVTASGEKCFLRPDSDDDTIGFEFIPPKRGYHNTTDGAYLLSRIPARQYLRGICSRNTAVRSVYGTAVDVNFKTLELLFEKPVSPLEELVRIQGIKKGTAERSVALSGQFAVSLDAESIMCLGETIGKASLNENVFKIELNDLSLWGVEVKDALRRAGLTGEVT